MKNKTNLIGIGAAALLAPVAAIEEANALILANPTSEEVVRIAHAYTGAPVAAIKQGNHRLRFQTILKEEGLSRLADALVANGDIKENPGQKLYADAFKGVTWGK